MTTRPLDLSRVEALTFDCYGTLIDWETGILDGLRAVLEPHGVRSTDDGLLEAYARHEAELEAGSYLPYRKILATCLQRLCAEHGVVADAREQEAFASSVETWPPFDDTEEALRRLAKRYRLGVITNCDDDLFAASQRQLGVEFEWIVTAQQVGSYKPDQRNFLAALERIDLPRDRIVHVAQSLFHDHVPARELGIASVWIDRRHGRAGHGATPAALASPELTTRNLAEFAAIALA